MEIKTIIGFDHLPDYVDLDLGRDSGIVRYKEGLWWSETGVDLHIKTYADRKWLAMSNPSTGNSAGYLGWFTFDTANVDQSVPRTGKWIIGFRYMVGGSPQYVTSNVKMYTVVANNTETLRASTVSMGATNDTSYVEVIINWDLKIVTIYDTGVVEYNAYIPADTVNVRLRFGGDDGGYPVIRPSNGNWLGFTDYYLMHVPTGETQARLGSVKVVPSLISEVVSAPNWASSFSGNSLFVSLSSPLTANYSNRNSPYVKSGQASELGKFKFVEPVAPLGIKFVQIKARCAREPGVESDLQAYMTDGINVGPTIELRPVSQPETAHVSLGGYNTAPDGTEWTPAKVAAVMVAMRSIPVTPT